MGSKIYENYEYWISVKSWIIMNNRFQNVFFFGKVFLCVMFELHKLIKPNVHVI